LRLRDTIANFYLNIQKNLFPFIEEELGPLTKKQIKLIRILELVSIEKFIKQANNRYKGRPAEDRQILARAFVAKTVYNIPKNNQLRDQILSDKVLREICGWDCNGKVPSESTFSRAFSEFSDLKLPEIAHESLIRESLGNQLIGHVSRDSTAILSREKPYKNVKKNKKKKRKHKRGRPKKGEIREPVELSRLQKQQKMDLSEMLLELPKQCDVGNKVDSKGYKISWTGYKLHIDTADGDIPVSCVLTSASVHDSQVALPLAEITNKRITNLYDLMDAAYDSPIIKEHSKSLKHLPIIDVNPRRDREKKVEIKKESQRQRKLNVQMPKKLRYNERSSVERVNGRLKDEFGGRFLRVKGHKKVMAHLMFGILVLTADQLFKLIT
jgi:hypothetical protein